MAKMSGQEFWSWVGRSQQNQQRRKAWRESRVEAILRGEEKMSTRKMSTRVLPKELLDALEAAKALPGSAVSALLETAIDKLELWYGDKKKQDVEVESVDVVIRTCERGEDDMLIEQRKRTIKLDPKDFSCEQSQQYHKEYNTNGEIVNMHRQGKPVLVLRGKVVDNRDEALIEPVPPELDVCAEKLANVVTIRAYWKGRTVLKYEVTDQALLVENVKHHVGLMCDRIWDKVGRDKVSRGQIRKGLLVAISNQSGMAVID